MSLHRQSVCCTDRHDWTDTVCCTNWEHSTVIYSFSLHRCTHRHTWSQAHMYAYILYTLYVDHIGSYSIPVLQLYFTNSALIRAYREIVTVLQSSVKYRSWDGGIGKARLLSRIDAPPNLTIWSQEKKNISFNQCLFCILPIPVKLLKIAE